MNCTKCGAKLRSNATFCNNCGQKVVSAVSPFPIIGMVGIAIFMGLITWFWDMLAIHPFAMFMDNMLVCLFGGIFASFFLLICYLLPLKYSLLSMVILGVLDICTFGLQHYSLLIGILCRLLTILIVHALARIKNNFLFYICPVIIISTVLGSLAWLCMNFNAFYLEWSAWGGYFFRDSLIGFLRNPLNQLLIVDLIGGLLATGIYLWVRKSYPQFIQKLR